MAGGWLESWALGHMQTDWPASAGSLLCLHIMAWYMGSGTRCWGVLAGWIGVCCSFVCINCFWLFGCGGGCIDSVNGHDEHDLIFTGCCSGGWVGVMVWWYEVLMVIPSIRAVNPSCVWVGGVDELSRLYYLHG